MMTTATTAMSIAPMIMAAPTGTAMDNTSMRSSFSTPTVPGDAVWHAVTIIIYSKMCTCTKTVNGLA